jgi:hypothetical protein
MPVNLQRRLPDGIWVVIIALAIYGLERMDFQSHWKVLLSTSISILVLPSTFFLITGGINAAIRPGMPVFRPADEVEAFSFISEQLDSKSVILTSYQTGNPLPAWVPLTVMVGHGPESTNLARSLSFVEEFFNSDLCNQKCRDFLIENKVQYVFWGPEEQKLGSGNPERMDVSHLVFNRGKYKIFEIIPTD